MHAAGPYPISCNGESGGYFVWKDYGLEINFPSRCSQQNIQVTISILLPISNEVHPSVHIVSAVYQFNCDIERFDKPFTLYLQHCVKLQSPEDCQKMRFIVVQDGSSVVKYGCFEVGKSYGTVTLNRFCYIFIVWVCELWKNFRMIILPPSDEQDNSTNQPNNSHVETYVDDLSTSQGDHTRSSQFACRQQCGPSQAVSPSSVVVHATSPTYDYEAMIGLPRDYHDWTNWRSYYSIYRGLGTWRQVCM